MNHYEKTQEILLPVREMLDRFRSTTPREILSTLEAAEPPKEWIVTEVSKLNGKQFSYVPINVMEVVCKAIFTLFDIGIEGHTISQDKGKFAATTYVLVGLGWNGCTDLQLYGCATEIAPTIEHLQLATPLSRKKAVGNALRSHFGLFGRYLNWELADSSAADSDKPATTATNEDDEFNRLLTAIKEAPTKAAAQAIIDGSALYRTVLPLNQEVKEALKSKPE